MVGRLLSYFAIGKVTFQGRAVRVNSYLQLNSQNRSYKDSIFIAKGSMGYMNSFHEARGCFSSHLISVYSGTRTWTTASAKLQCTTPMPKAVSKC